MGRIHCDACNHPPHKVERFVQGTAAKVTMLDEITNPLLDALPLYQPIPVKKLRTQLSTRLADDLINDMLALLIGKGDLVLVQDPATIKAVRVHTDKFNQYIIQKSNGEISYLASPVTGGGVQVERLSQLFLLAYHKKLKRKEWEQFVWQTLESQGQRTTKDGKILETAEENLAYLNEVAESFETESLPKLQALQVI